MPPSVDSDSARTAAKTIEAAFDKDTPNGADRATDALIAEISQNPTAASAILRRIARDDDAKHDNVLASIALTDGERLLSGTGPLDTEVVNSILTRPNLKSIEANPPGDSPGEKAVIQMSAHYLSKHYWQIAGRTYDAPANADGTEHNIPIIAQDLSMTAERKHKQPGWNEPQKVYTPTFGKRIYYALNKIL